MTVSNRVTLKENKMNFMNFINNAHYMGEGMLSIIIVMGVIILLTSLLKKL